MRFHTSKGRISFFWGSHYFEFLLETADREYFFSRQGWQVTRAWCTDHTTMVYDHEETERMKNLEISH